MINQLSRRPSTDARVVFIDGLFGSGKSLFSSVVSSMERVELMSFLHELEYSCILHGLGKMSMNTARTMIRIQTDLKVYNTVMGRDVNFRPTDMSSAIKYHNPSRYFQRLFSQGDEQTLKTIKEEKPILNLAVHNLLSYSEPIWEALGGRCSYINVVRHPIYMTYQQSYQMKVSIKHGGVRDFAIFYNYKGKDMPYYAHKWEERYLNANSLERAIYYTDELTSRNKKSEKKIREKYNVKILTVPFEPFVLNPGSWVKKIANEVGVNVTSATNKVMFKQNIPRDKVSAGLDLDTYIRYGWKPPIDGANEADELAVRRESIASKVSAHAITVLDKLSKEYENEYWKP